MKHSSKHNIIPALLVHSKREFIDRLAFIQKHHNGHSLLQIDIADGKFVPNTTWPTPSRIKALITTIPFEVHLMVQNPDNFIEAWKQAGVKKIIFHVESTKNPIKTACLIKKQGIKAFVAINPETPISALLLLLPLVDGILVMGVHPGFSGQSMLESTKSKIRSICRMAPHSSIEVDGGVTSDNVDALQKAGAQWFAMGSAYFNS